MKALLLLAVFCFLAVSARRLLPDAHVFNQRVDSLLPHPNSVAIMQFLTNRNGDNFKSNNRFQIDNSMYLLHVGSGTQFLQLNEVDYTSPDCDAFKPTTFPVPAAGAIEGSAPGDYSCGGGDCHLLVVDQAGGYFYESYLSEVASGQVTTGCALRWCMSFDYPGFVGDQCTSADAAGYPIAPLLFTVDELSDGVIDHALRMTLPNDWFGTGYVAPATHGTTSNHSTNANAPFYGYRFRLKSSFNETSFNPASKIVITALKQYGIYLADGGNFPLLMASDAYSQTGMSYSTDFNFDTHSLIGIKVSDFEVVQSSGALQPVTFNCVPNSAPTTCASTSGNSNTGASASASASGSASGGSSSCASATAPSWKMEL